MKPSIGRIVHFVDIDNEHQAAIVTAVRAYSLEELHEKVDPEATKGETVIDVQVFGTKHAARPFFDDVTEDQGASVLESWHWPEREPA